MTRRAAILTLSPEDLGRRLGLRFADDVVNVRLNHELGLVEVDRLAADGVTVTVSGSGPMAAGLKAAGVASDDGPEPLLLDAAAAVVTHQLGSARHVARHLSIGQDRARDLLDQLETHGIVGPTVHGRSRDVLATPDQLDAVRRQLGARD